ncbi:NADH-cytochrome b5 reductase 1 [Galdieria sulphuraria]|uniref:NADH-cytochrome b5 reductase n=1 Tax=Galdieria sulphuraria TaxID=130081 RepID=M2WVU7_GALSU|nr:cytochrome-b5 reductase [Galdieria sulphuraria]EME28115.1 cytochrome-b5 reductase [Galdieria sulphuraria]GJD12151.1 NADH-cytochrome b5 reductase 1 [Galdieria sulphuraria]|eukprot:XP_005704635.1 cytochrome-b5 reductase [Galdieria sulphuraria]
MEECPVDSAHEERMTELGERISDLIATPKPYMDSIKQLVSLGSSSNTIVFSLLLGILLGAASYIGFQRRKRTNEPLDPVEYREFLLVDKTIVSHNTRKFRLAFADPETILNLPLGNHVSVKAVVDNKEVSRPYTPISPKDTKGYFELLIKVYPAPYGTMSRYLDSLKLGDSLWVRGPKGKFTYSRNMRKCIGMIAGGTGITPMYQLIQAILSDPQETTVIRLIFANVTIDDILLKDELESFAKNHSRFRVFFVLNQPPENWRQGVGFVTREHIEQHIGMPQRGEKMVLRCGPPPMNKAMHSILIDMGYEEEDLFKF